MINANVFSQCKKGVYIVNVGRGGLINEKDLLEGIKNGQVIILILNNSLKKVRNLYLKTRILGWWSCFRCIRARASYRSGHFGIDPTS